MDFISTYGLFLAKAVTLVVAVAAIVMIVMNAALRNRYADGVAVKEAEEVIASIADGTWQTSDWLMVHGG